MGISDIFGRHRKHDSDAPRLEEGSVHPTKALARFLTGLAARPRARLIDLGPVVGSNVTFFGEELGCKIFVEDLAAEIDRYVREDRIDDLAACLSGRFSQPDDSIDGILCWDVFDYLPRSAAQALAARLIRLLRPDGVLLAFFATVQPPSGVRPVYTRHVVLDRVSIRHKPYAAVRGKQRPLLNRDIERMFEPLRVAEQFLLKTNMREVLLRKPAVQQPAASQAHEVIVDAAPAAVRRA